ncbi:MAG TPA: hypothetical protein VHT29_02885, partial [Solirubrobacteraceae bacterium]|nr:hypothetical protein [Solirubrobacteraceae bacterium]
MMTRRGVVLAVLVAALASLGTASSAFAKEPQKGFKVFNQCPRFTKEVSLCLYDQTTGGEVVLNKQKVPVTKTIT